MFAFRHTVLPLFACAAFRIEQPMDYVIQWQFKPSSRARNDESDAVGTGIAWVDADRDGAGVHVHLGVERPTRDLRDAALLGLDEAASETPFPGLSLLAAIAAAPDGDLPPRSAQQALCSAAQALPVDYLLIDLPPGAAPLTLDLLLLAHSALVVLVPEAPAIEGAYRLLRAAFLHSLRGVVEEGAQAALEDALRTAAEHGGVSPFDLLEALGEQAELCGAVKAVLQRLRPRLVVNQTRTRADLDLGLQLRSAARRRLGLGGRVPGAPGQRRRGGPRGAQAAPAGGRASGVEDHEEHRAHRAEAAGRRDDAGGGCPAADGGADALRGAGDRSGR